MKTASLSWFVFVLSVTLYSEIYSTPLSLETLITTAHTAPEAPHMYQRSFITAQEFETTHQACMQLMRNQLRKQQHWIAGGSEAGYSLFITPLSEFRPFVQRLIVPDKSTAALFGDLHGDIHSLLTCLQYLRDKEYIDDNFTIIRPDFYMLFLGDFVDRGMYGVEVLYTLMRLKLANPQHVMLVRGNHEDARLNTNYGFAQELAYKFPLTKPSVYELYDCLPVAVYVGSECPTGYDYVLCCHGGLEPGFSPHTLLGAQAQPITYQLIGVLNRGSRIQTLNTPALVTTVMNTIPAYERTNGIMLKQPTRPVTLGFMWSDFIVDEGKEIVAYTQGRGWMFGKQLTRELLRLDSTPYARVHGVIRAHQHYGDMLEKLQQNNGMAPLWDGLVTTLLSAPIMTDDHSCCAFAMLTTNSTFALWQLERIVCRS